MSILSYRIVSFHYSVLSSTLLPPVLILIISCSYYLHAIAYANRVPRCLTGTAFVYKTTSQNYRKSTPTTPVTVAILYLF